MKTKQKKNLNKNKNSTNKLKKTRNKKNKLQKKTKKGGMMNAARQILITPQQRGLKNLFLPNNNAEYNYIITFLLTSLNFNVKLGFLSKIPRPLSLHQQIYQGGVYQYLNKSTASRVFQDDFFQSINDINFIEYIKNFGSKQSSEFNLYDIIILNLLCREWYSTYITVINGPVSQPFITKKIIWDNLVKSLNSISIPETNNDNEGSTDNEFDTISVGSDNSKLSNISIDDSAEVYNYTSSHKKELCLAVFKQYYLLLNYIKSAINTLTNTQLLYLTCFFISTDDDLLIFFNRGIILNLSLLLNSPPNQITEDCYFSILCSLSQEQIFTEQFQDIIKYKDRINRLFNLVSQNDIISYIKNQNNIYINITNNVLKLERIKICYLMLRLLNETDQQFFNNREYLIIGLCMNKISANISTGEIQVEYQIRWTIDTRTKNYLIQNMHLNENLPFLANITPLD